MDRASSVAALKAAESVPLRYRIAGFDVV